VHGVLVSEWPSATRPAWSWVFEEYQAIAIPKYLLN